MFDVGGLELLLIAVVGLLVIGPERLPEALRSIGLQLGRLRRAFTSVKTEIEKEIGMDEIRRQLHNEAVMDEMKRIEKEVQTTQQEMNIDPNAAMFAEARKEQDEQEAKQEQDSDQLPDSDPDEDAPTDAASASDVSTDEPSGEPLVEPEPKNLPPTEADLEAAWERKQRAQKNK